jgi:isoleucyl-tRNA synthetase
MTDAARDYSETLFLPKTDFPMRAGLPQKEPEILARWPARAGRNSFSTTGRLTLTATSISAMP